MPQELLGHQIILLGRHKFWAVDGQKRLALPHRFVCCVGVDLLNPSRKTNLHVGEPRFIRLDISEGPDLVTYGPVFHNASLNANALHPIWRQRDWHPVWPSSRWSCGRRSLILCRRFCAQAREIMARPPAQPKARGSDRGKDGGHVERARAGHSSPPINRSIAASADCSSICSWNNLSSRAWTRCCASSAMASSPRPWE